MGTLLAGSYPGRNVRSAHQRRQRLRGRGLRGRSGRRLDRDRDRQQPRLSEHPEGTAGEHGRSEGAHRRPQQRRRRSHPDGLVDDGCADDPCREHHAGRRERDPGRHRGRTDERNRSQASESPRHPRRRPGERDHHPRVRPWRFEPPDGRSWCQLPVRQRAGGRGVERLFRDHSAARPGARRSQPAAWSRPVCALPGRPAWGRHPAAALHARHGDPAVHLRQHQDRRLAERNVIGGPPRHRPWVGGRAVGPGLGPDRQARLQPERLRRLELGRQQPFASVRDRRSQVPGLQPGARRRTRRNRRRH